MQETLQPLDPNTNNTRGRKVQLTQLTVGPKRAGALRSYVHVTFSTPWNEEGVVIEMMRTLGTEDAVYGRLPNREKPGVFVDTPVTVHGTLPPGPGNPHVMNGMAPPGGLRVTVPESSPLSPQALSGEFTLRPVILTEGPEEAGGLLATEAIIAMMTMRNTTKMMIRTPQYGDSARSTGTCSTMI